MQARERKMEGEEKEYGKGQRRGKVCFFGFEGDGRPRNIHLQKLVLGRVCRIGLGARTS